MAEKVTGKIAKFSISGGIAEEKDKKILAEDFKKKLPRRKKPKTYFRKFNDVLKYLIEIDVNIDLIAQYNNLVERYVNFFPDIIYLLNIYHSIFMSSIKLQDINIRLKEDHNHRSEKAKERFIESMEEAYKAEELKFSSIRGEYLEYIILHTGQKFINTGDVKKYSKTYILKHSENFLKVYAHSNTFKEASYIYYEILKGYISFRDAADIYGEITKVMKINKGFEKSELKKIATTKLTKLFSLYNKEHKELTKMFKNNLEDYYDEKK